MLRAYGIARAGTWPLAAARGAVTLPAEARYRRRARLELDAGGEVMLDLPEAEMLADGDALVAQEGGYILIRAAFEEVVEIRAEDAGALTALAWHIGNRHIPAEIHADRIVVADDRVVVDMLRGLGARVRRLRAKFTPTGGAYAAEQHAHE